MYFYSAISCLQRAAAEAASGAKPSPAEDYPIKMVCAIFVVNLVSYVEKETSISDDFSRWSFPPQRSVRSLC